MKNQLSTLAFVLSLGAPLLAQTPTYEIEDLGTLGGPAAKSEPGSIAYGLGADGSVVGTAIIGDTAPDVHGFRRFGATLLDLPPLAGDKESIAYAYGGGYSVGVSYNLGDLAPSAVRWSGATPQLLGAFSPRDVNAAGTVVGAAKAPDASSSNAVLWNGVLTQLGSLGGSSSAFAIDDAGRVVGGSYLTNGTTRRAFFWGGGPMVDLGTLGGVNSQALDINAAGDVVGVADTPAGQAHAFRYEVDAAGTVLTRTDLGVLAGDFSFATAVNSAGVVVGVSDSRAFVWDGALTDLNERVPGATSWQLFRANAISDGGWIAGYGMHAGNHRAFLLRPALFLDASASSVGPGESVTLRANTGGTGLPGGVALTAVNGIPLLVVLSTGAFDASGDFTLTIPPMPSLSGLVLTFAGGGVLPNGAVDISPGVNVSFL